MQNPSVWHLASRGYFALVLCVMLGLMASAPAINARVRCFVEWNYLIGARPADDRSLEEWAMAQPKVVSFAVGRRGEELRIRSEYRGVFGIKPTPAQLGAELDRLGYAVRGMRGGSMGMIGGFGETLTHATTLAAMLAGMQAAFGIVGINRIRAAARRGQPLSPLFSGQPARAVGFGVLAGLGLLGLGVLHAYALNALLGQAPPSPWDSSESMNFGTRAVFLLFGALGAPIAEEIFFRGYLFGRFRQAGYPGFGVFFSAVLFGGVHFSDPYNMPGICLFGICLAWLYHRTGSLLAPMVAHMVNNGVAILWMILR